MEWMSLSLPTVHFPTVLSGGVGVWGGPLANLAKEHQLHSAAQLF